jgi:glucose/mannose-6-phosphate isomerase
MSMENALRDFPKQFEFEPVVENADLLEPRDKFVIAGMGGSCLAPDLLRAWRPELDIIAHRDYGLPAVDLSDRLIIASSYSGNTEETLDAFAAALERRLPVVAIGVGGELLKLASANRTPFIRIPDTGIQPRSALGFNLVAFMAIVGDDAGMDELRELRYALDSGGCERHGAELAARLRGKVPLIYASERNRGVAYNWKIKFNETGKIPAFLNVFPELNHNEMTGFDRIATTAPLSNQTHCLFLTDTEDDPRVQRRMEVCRDLYVARWLPVDVVPLEGKTVWQRMVTSLLTADWMALRLAEAYGAESEQVPMVEEFKKLIS